MAIDINIYKLKKEEQKKIRIVEKDLSIVIKNLSRYINELAPFGMFVPVQECISVLQNSKTLLEIHHNNCKRALKR